MKHPSDSEVLLYQTDDGTTSVEIRMAGETVWLNQNQMADHHQAERRPAYPQRLRRGRK